MTRGYFGSINQSSTLTLTNPIQFKGAISANTDFPLVADVQTGWFYRILVDVTDNAGATYTNTGQSFSAGDEVAWNGSDWTELGSTDLWIDDSTDIYTATSTRGVKAGYAKIADTNQSNYLQVYWNENDTSDRTLAFKVNSGNRTLDLYENFTIGDGYDITITAEDAASSIVLDNATLEIENANATQRAMKIVHGTDADATLTIEGTSSVINQDVSSDATPNFAALGIGIVTTPSETLHVEGAIRVGYATDTFDGMLDFYRNDVLLASFTNLSSELYMSAQNNKAIHLVDDSNKGLTVADGGNVGIGTVSPGAILTVVTNADNESLQIRRNSVSDNDPAILGFRNSTGDDPENNVEIHSVRTNSPSANDAEIYIKNRQSGALTTAIFVDTAGKIGFGNLATVNAQAHVYKNSGSTILLESDNSFDASMELMESSGTGSDSIFGTTGNGFRIRHDGSENKIYFENGNSAVTTTAILLDRTNSDITFTGNILIDNTVDNADPGKSLIVKRTAAEGNNQIKMYVTDSRNASIELSDSNTSIFSSGTDITIRVNNGINSLVSDVANLYIGADYRTNNPSLFLGGYITADTAMKYVQFQVSDTDDKFHITEEDAYILGMAIDMPLDTENIKINGSQIIKRTASATDYNPSALTTDYIIAITNTDEARSVTISTEDEDSGTTSNPRIMVIKDESGNAGTNNITITLESGGNIDGAANFVLNADYNSVTVYMDGTNAWIV